MTSEIQAEVNDLKRTVKKLEAAIQALNLAPHGSPGVVSSPEDEKALDLAIAKLKAPPAIAPTLEELEYAEKARRVHSGA